MRPSNVVLLALTISTAAFAQPYKRLANQAAEALEDAEAKARRAGGQCRGAVVNALDAATDHVYDLRKGTRARDAQAVKAELSAIASNASMAGCPTTVLENIQKAIEGVEEVRVQLWSEQRNGRDDQRDDRRDDRRDNRRDDQQPPQVADDEQDGNQFAQLAVLTVNTNDRFEGEPAVKVAVPELKLQGMQGRSFYLAARFRSYEGQWTDWVTTQKWSVPNNPFVWKNAFNHYFRASTLAEDDFSDGRFVASVAVFDGDTGRVLATREATFRIKSLPQLPPAPVQPVVVQPVQPNVQPDQPYVARDCGTGNDVGCGVPRNGQYAMDANVFNNVLQSLRGQPNESLRAQTCQSVFQRNYATAFQFGMVLDLFANELLRMTVVQYAATRVVNPQHAVGFAGKFGNPQLQAQFTQIMLAQGGGQGGYVPPPNGYVPPPNGGAVPPPLPPPAYGQPGYGQQPGYAQPVRDCGTGNDPGCGMNRNGQWAMDGQTFQGVMVALRSNQNELTRQNIVNDVLRNNALTALQLGAIMDLFSSELVKLDVAKAAAPRVVNPMHALAFAAKFRNDLLGQDFARVYSSQR